MRAHFAGDVMGQTITTYFEGLNDTDSYPLVADEWVVTDRINAETNRTFSSWAEFFGPHAFDGDEFTTTQRYNLSDTAFVEGAVGYPNETFTIYGYDNEPSPANNAPPFAAEDIIIVSSLASSLHSIRPSSKNVMLTLFSSPMAYANPPVLSSWK